MRAVRHGRLIGAVVLACLLMGLQAAGAHAAGAVDWTGHWTFTDYCTSGPSGCPGTYIYEIDLVQSGALVTGTGSPYTSEGSASGSTYSFKVFGAPPYTATFKMTMAADEESATGDGVDYLGRVFTVTGARSLGPGRAAVSGTVLNRQDAPVKGVPMVLKGKNHAEEDIEKTVKTNDRGDYSFEVPAGSYSVTSDGEPDEENGGSLGVRTAKDGSQECAGAVSGASCVVVVEAGDRAHANFTYTQCSSDARLANGKQVTGCPIVFVPGFLGSILRCSTGEVWPNLPNPDFADMILRSDGVTNDNARGACQASVGPTAGKDGVVRWAGRDIYGAVLDYLDRIAPGRVYAYPYDWRKSPEVAIAGLSSLVDEVLEKTHAKHVVLLAHSMGGLVTQLYISSPSSAAKVIRAVTLGTPYWGAVKSHVALMTGKSNEVAQESFGLDNFIQGAVSEETEGFGGNPAVNDLQLSARNMQGLFWLYPADEFGPWLQIVAPHYPFGFSKSSQIRAWVASLGANPNLIGNAVAGHAAINGYPANGVDFQVLAGAGTPTESALKVEENPASLTQPVTAWYQSGDGTVPLVSATEGASEGKAAAVPIHYACRVGHIDLPADPGVQSRIEGFLLKGEEIKGPEDKCPYTGVSMRIFEPVIPEHGLAKVAAAKPTKISVLTPSGPMSLGKAAAGGLITRFQAGGVRLVATTEQQPVTLLLEGTNVTVGVRSIKSGGAGLTAGNGPETLYGPVTGTITVSPKGVVKKGSTVLKPVRRTAAPRTRAKVTRHGKRFIVRLSASPASAVTYYRFGKGRSLRYRKPLKLTAAKLRALRFESVNRFGVWERPRRVAR